VASARSRRSVAPLVLGRVALVAWGAFWFWAFSWQYSSGFFRYDLAARLPPFLAMLAAAIALPWSAGRQWWRFRRGERTRMAAFGRHLLATGAALGVPFGVVAAMRVAPRALRPSADDAMGIGLDFLAVLAIAITAALGLGVALASSRPARGVE
jgi:branched-subunit amino acid ABC-type transport system permease component